MSHSWSSLRTLACKNRGQPLLCGDLLGFHSLVDEEQELKDARDADDDEIPVRLHQHVMELKKEPTNALLLAVRGDAQYSCPHRKQTRLHVVNNKFTFGYKSVYCLGK